MKILSRFSVKPLRNVGTRLVDHHLNIVSLRAQLPVAALNSLAVVLFRLDHQQKLVHESSDAPRWTGLAKWRHVKNNVVEITCLKVRHHVEEFFQTELSWTGIW